MNNCYVNFNIQVLNVQVPFLFKYAVDYLNTDPAMLAHASSAMVTMGTALLLGCKYSKYSY